MLRHGVNAVKPVCLGRCGSSLQGKLGGQDATGGRAEHDRIWGRTGSQRLLGSLQGQTVGSRQGIGQGEVQAGNLRYRQGRTFARGGEDSGWRKPPLGRQQKSAQLGDVTRTSADDA